MDSPSKPRIMKSCEKGQKLLTKSKQIVLQIEKKEVLIGVCRVNRREQRAKPSFQYPCE